MNRGGQHDRSWPREQRGAEKPFGGRSSDPLDRIQPSLDADSPLNPGSANTLGRGVRFGRGDSDSSKAGFMGFGAFLAMDQEGYSQFES